MYNGFKPIFNKKSKVLILGSFPSVKSREKGFYYGNKQNRFWKMLQSIFDEKFEDNIISKTKFLNKYNIALFDVISRSDLIGSADNSLEKSNYSVASLDKLLPPNTQVEKILCNGKTAYNLLLHNYNFNLPIICMPSTSSANPKFNIEQWEAELKFLLQTKKAN